MTRRRVFICAAVAIIVSHLSANGAYGDDEAPPVTTAPPAPVVIGGAGYLHLKTLAHVQTEGGSHLDLPPGYYISEDNYHLLDGEVRRLQDAETRKDAENASLRASLSTWQPGWKTITCVFIAGIAGGWYVKSKFD